MTPREFQIADLRKLCTKALIEVMKLAVAARNDPCSCGHLITSAPSHLDHICGFVSNMPEVHYQSGILTHSIFLSIFFSTNHDRLDGHRRTSIQAIVTLLNDVLLPLQFFSVYFSL